MTTESVGGGPLRVAVVGAGAFGRNHLRVYRELEQAGYPVELAAVVDPDESARGRAAADFGVRGFQTIAECMAAAIPPKRSLDGAPGSEEGAPGRIAAASVCVPTVHHAACARELMAAGVDVLIEKPLAASLAEADEIVATARTLGRVVQVGHLERFNPAVRAVRGLLNRPMFFEVHRLSVFTPRSLDVDVVLDLMIHDLDIVMKLVGEPVREVRAVGLPVLSRNVDIANVRLEFENGCVANFTASRVSTERVRKMRFFQPHQYLSVDFARQDLLLIDVTAAAGMDMAQLAKMAAAAGMSTGGHPSPGMSIRKVPVEAGEPLRLEIEAFLEAVRGRTEPVVTAEDGRAALGLALEINSAIASHARRTGL
ncbi:MAG: Gfo/Idh/MocA family oxidoreductase [Acidobacteriaceae bacterium]|jgi:predicted dehydrogenase